MQHDACTNAAIAKRVQPDPSNPRVIYRVGSTFFDADMRPVEIVIDDYFVENNWLAASGSVVGKALVELAGDTLIGTICHEIAHLTHFRHGKKHTRLTQEYIALVRKPTAL